MNLVVILYIWIPYSLFLSDIFIYSFISSTTFLIILKAKRPCQIFSMGVVKCSKNNDKCIVYNCSSCCRGSFTCELCSNQRHSQCSVKSRALFLALIGSNDAALRSAKSYFRQWFRFARSNWSCLIESYQFSKSNLTATLHLNIYILFQCLNRRRPSF